MSCAHAEAHLSPDMKAARADFEQKAQALAGRVEIIQAGLPMLIAFIAGGGDERFARSRLAGLLDMAAPIADQARQLYEAAIAAGVLPVAPAHVHVHHEHEAIAS